MSKHSLPQLWNSFIKRLAAASLSSRLLAHILHHIDRFMMRLSGGRTTLTRLLTGLPVVWLTTIGAKSGNLHTVPLLPITDQEKIILIASNWGSAHHPAWYYNLRANPRVTFSLNGHTVTYQAREATPYERERYWSRAVAIYPGWQAYRQRAQNRQIPIMILSPSQKPSTGPNNP